MSEMAQATVGALVMARAVYKPGEPSKMRARFVVTSAQMAQDVVGGNDRVNELS